jgi:hypothetical protein
MGLQMADCSVVVNKFEPMKPGDSVEGKAQTIICRSHITCLSPKRNKQRRREHTLSKL